MEVADHPPLVPRAPELALDPTEGAEHSSFSCIAWGFVSFEADNFDIEILVVNGRQPGRCPASRL